MQGLLDILVDSEFDTTRLAKTTNELRKVDNEIVESIPLEMCILSNGKKLFYHNLFSVLKVILNNNILTQGWKFTFDQREENHWCGYKAWKDYEDALNLRILQTSQFAFLLLLVFFIDDYLCDKSKHQSNTGIYFTVANFQTPLLLQRKSKFCLCTFASDGSIYQEVLEKVVLAPCKQLLQGWKCFFSLHQSEVFFFGGLHCFVHDHIGAVKTLMKLGPKATNPSRFFENNDFSIVQHPLEKPQLKTKKILEILQEIIAKQSTHGKIGYARELAKEYGFQFPVEDITKSVYSEELNIFSIELFL